MRELPNVYEMVQDSTKYEQYAQNNKDGKVRLFLDIPGNEGANGIHYAHFNYLLSAVKWKHCETHLEAVRQLWIGFWPTLKSIMNAYGETRNMLHEEWKDQDVILNNYAKAETERKFMEEYLKKKQLDVHYQAWRSTFGVPVPEKTDSSSETDKGTEVLQEGSEGN